MLERLYPCIRRIINLKRAFDQVLVLYDNDFGSSGEFVGLDIKALRTQEDSVATHHLSHSREIFLLLLAVVKQEPQLRRSGAIHH